MKCSCFQHCEQIAPSCCQMLELMYCTVFSSVFFLYCLAFSFYLYMYQCCCFYHAFNIDQLLSEYVYVGSSLFGFNRNIVVIYVVFLDVTSMIYVVFLHVGVTSMKLVSNLCFYVILFHFLMDVTFFLKYIYSQSTIQLSKV